MNNKKINIAVVEDDPVFNKLIVIYLKNNGFKKVTGHLSGEDAVSNINEKPNIVIQDYDLTGMNGMETMKKIKKRFPSSEFIFLSGQNSIQIAVDTLKLGAYDYIIKDSMSKEKVLSKVRKLMDIQKLIRDRKIYKYGVIIFGVLLVVSWSIIIFLEFIEKI